jgi:hypothetical protein
MKAIGRRGARWAGIVAVALFVAARGGGGGSTPTPVTAAAPPADARNGSYTMYAADAHEYTLALDFDAKTYQLNGNGAAESGTFAQQGPAYVFPVGNASGATGQSITRFVMGTEVPGNYSQSAFRVSPPSRAFVRSTRTRPASTSRPAPRSLPSWWPRAATRSRPA